MPAVVAGTTWWAGPNAGPVDGELDRVRSDGDGHLRPLRAVAVEAEGDLHRQRQRVAQRSRTDERRRRRFLLRAQELGRQCAAGSDGDGHCATRPAELDGGTAPVRPGSKGHRVTRAGDQRPGIEEPRREQQLVVAVVHATEQLEGHG